MIAHAAIFSPHTRRGRILAVLDRQGERSIEVLAQEFGVSEMTIRRDLQELADEGRIIRTRGGAAPAGHISFAFSFLERTRQHAAEKEHIARIALSLIRPGQSVLLDSSTTTLAIARQLPTIPGLTVITTSLPIASALYGRDGIDVMLLGGVLRNTAPDLTGALTESSLELIRADIAFIGADAIDEDGFIYNTSPEVGRMLKRMADAATRVCAVADHSKIGRHQLMRFANVADWHGLITDTGLDPDIGQRLVRAGVQLLQEARPEVAAEVAAESATKASPKPSSGSKREAQP